MTEARKREMVSLRDLRRMGVLQPHHMERMGRAFVWRRTADDGGTVATQARVSFPLDDPTGARFPLTGDPDHCNWSDMQEVTEQLTPVYHRPVVPAYIFSVGDLSRTMHAMNWRRWGRVIGAALHDARAATFDREKPPLGLDEAIRVLRHEFLTDNTSAPHRTMAGDWPFAGFRRSSPEMAVMVAAHNALKAAHPEGDADAAQVAEQIDLVIDARRAIVSAWREEVSRAEKREQESARPERESQE